MSELANNNQIRNEKLVSFAMQMLDGEPGSVLYQEYRDHIEKASPYDVIKVVDELAKTNEDIVDIKRVVNKLLNLFYKPIKKHGKFQPEKGSLLHFLISENREMEKRMTLLKADIKDIFSRTDKRKALLDQKDYLKLKFQDLQEYDKHHIKKENILFPYFEKMFPEHRCVNVMWSMHDDAKKSLNKLIKNLGRDVPSINEFNYEIGRFYFSILPVIFREEYILYPIAHQVIISSDWEQMLEESLEIGFAFIESPVDIHRNASETKSVQPDIKNELIDLETGKLSVSQIRRMFNHLPVDITFVDENDEVKYFSSPKDRFFARSKAIIGRKVQNCHPPESIDIVNEIVNSFRKGEKDKEAFWIQLKGRYILIQYFAIRDKQGVYKGIAEVSQDITEIRKLEGEKRLLDNFIKP